MKIVVAYENSFEVVSVPGYYTPKQIHSLVKTYNWFGVAEKDDAAAIQEAVEGGLVYDPELHSKFNEFAERRAAFSDGVSDPLPGIWKTSVFNTDYQQPAYPVVISRENLLGVSDER